ncbi:hypothetical protein V5799_006735, partial [Amblyomma americanum]
SSCRTAPMVLQRLGVKDVAGTFGEELVLFLTPVPETLLCSECTSLAEEMRSDSKGHVFCNPCLRKLDKGGCFRCRRDGATELIHKLQNEHLATCPAIPMACCFRELGCSFQGTKALHAEHLKSENHMELLAKALIELKNPHQQNKILSAEVKDLKRRLNALQNHIRKKHPELLKKNGDDDDGRTKRKMLFDKIRNINQLPSEETRAPAVTSTDKMCYDATPMRAALYELTLQNDKETPCVDKTATIEAFAVECP